MELTQTNSKATPKDFFFWLGVLVTLGTSVYSFIDVIFSSINYVFPDLLSAGYYSGNMAYSMASLIVVFPVFIILMRFIRQGIKRDSSRALTWVRRWSLFFILFAAAATFVTDLIVLIYTFLNGEELTTRFVLKVVVVLLVSGGGFLHFLADLRGYWDLNQKKSASVVWGVSVLVVAALGTAFFILGSPATQRALRFDDQRVSDLQSIQWQVVNYWQQKKALPKTLGDLNDPISGFSVPKDPEAGVSYEYSGGKGMSFQLCATFDRESRSTPSAQTKAVPLSISPEAENWAHAIGRVCFDRVIDPERYPPFQKTPPVM